MRIGKLQTAQDWFEADRLLATAFLHTWDDDEGLRKVQAQANGTEPRPEETWALMDDDGTMQAAVTTLSHRLWFGGQELPMGEVHMVGSRAESRGGGNVRALMAEILTDFKKRGDVFATLIPFSFAFYRKFGFEQTSGSSCYHIPMEQLSLIRCSYDVSKVMSEEDLAAVREVRDAYDQQGNLAVSRTDADWLWRGNGEFGVPDFLHPDRQVHTYVFWDGNRKACAYVSFAYAHEPGHPFFGELDVTDLAYLCPEALMGILGFLYRLRAKVGYVNIELFDDIDLTAILPESDKVDCKVGGHVMARVLDVPRALELMPHPDAQGSYVIAVDDEFMPENSGMWRVSFVGGAAQVLQANGAPDLQVSETTFCQLVAGRISLDMARVRQGTEINGNERVLRDVFARRSVHLTL